MEKKFYSMYDDMTKTYEMIDQMMSVIYDEMRHDPTNEQNYKVLCGLGHIALRTLTSQENFVYTYCQDEQTKERLYDRINEKKEMITDVIKNENHKTM